MENFELIIFAVVFVFGTICVGIINKLQSEIQDLKKWRLDFIDEDYKSRAEIDNSIDNCMEATSRCMNKIGELTSSVEAMQESIKKVDGVIDEMEEAAKTYSANEKAFAEGLSSILNYSAPTHNSKGDGKSK